NLVLVYEVVAKDRWCYFTLEYLPGFYPRRWLERTGIGAAPEDGRLTDQTTRTAPPLQEARTESSASTLEVASPFAPRSIPNVDFGRVRSVVTQLAEGLAFLHASGVIHRDVKPSNAICNHESVKLLDFGLALERRRQDEDLARESRVVGTAAYLAPEYLEKLQVSPAMDVYSLGVVAYELITGTPPFGGALHLVSRLHQKIEIARAATLNPDVPADLDALVARMLALDPADRPSARDVAAELSGALPHHRVARRRLRFVGREPELAQLTGRIADPEPRARLVLVTGPSGAGKTALIDEAIHRVRGRGGLIWRGRCHERERVPYRAFDLIIDDLATELAGDPRLARELDHVAALCRVFPVLAPLVDPGLGDEPPAADLRVERERALIAMTQLFRRMLRAPHGVVVIDDLQWADDDSLELLALLVARGDQALTVIASWTTDGPPPAALQALVERLGARIERLDVPQMTEDELAELIGELAPRAPRARLRAVAQLAAGSPYLAELIGSELGDADSSQPELGELLSAEARRLARLEPHERAVAEVAALAGSTASFEQLRALAELPSGRLHSALRGLEDARVVRATPSLHGDPVYAFYHQRLREAATAGISDELRRDRHRQFAAWHERTDGDPGQLAYHWQHAGDPGRAARWAITAAEAARAQLAWGIAADWYGRALQLGAPDPSGARAGRAETLFLGGKLAEAAEQFLELARGAARDGAGDAWRVRAAEAFLKLGELDRGLGVLDGVLERRGERRSRTRAVTVLRAAGVAARWLAPRPAPARRTAPTDDVLASAYRAIASFVSTPHPIEAFEYVLRGVALAERTGDRAAHSQGLAMLAAYLAAGSLGRFGDRAIARATRLADQSGVPYPGMVAAGCAGILAMLRGDWTAMRESHGAATQICRRLGLERSWEASFLGSYWALGECYAGEPARALAMLDELAGDADDLFGRAMIGSYRGRALVLLGDLAAARALARELDRAPAAHRGLASVYRQVFAAELALAEHDWRRAGALAGALTTTMRAQWLSVMPAISAMVEAISATADLGLAAAGERGAAERAIATARRLHRRGRSSFYAVTALRLWGQGARLLGDHATAGRILMR
ncbi:MAG: protein kinase domain-containing protein, partial [Kofleriaceae bacterium]